MALRGESNKKSEGPKDNSIFPNLKISGLRTPIRTDDGIRKLLDLRGTSSEGRTTGKVLSPLTVFQQAGKSPSQPKR